MNWAFDPTQRRVAKCIEGDHPRWRVLWGVYSRSYCAFPAFCTPPGTIVAAQDPRKLITLMREAEIEFGARPPHRPPPGELGRTVPGAERAPSAGLPPDRGHEGGRAGNRGQ